MEFQPRKLDGLFDVIGGCFADDRGFQTKPYDLEPFAAQGFEKNWKQVIHNFSHRANTVRGLYVQRQPFTEGKLVACVQGRFFWVVVDLRQDSPTFGQWDGVHLKPTDGRALLIAPGFAHGCLSLSDEAALLLMADNVHAPDYGIAIAWNDSEIGIEWPLSGATPILSEAHARAMTFAAFRDTVGGI
jgi:dTDP-4-dehydrorhamnose 3,5-epimerase